MRVIGAIRIQERSTKELPPIYKDISAFGQSGEQSPPHPPATGW